MQAFVLSATALAIACGTALAHDGRRFEIVVSDNMLYAHGYIADDIDDGGGLIRPYYNAMHDHWSNHPNPAVPAAGALLPGFDIYRPGPLTGHQLVLTLTGSSKWVSPPTTMPPSDLVPDLVPLDSGEEIFVTYDATVSTSSLGAFELVSSVSPGGHLDLDLAYDIADRPAGVIYVLEFELSSPGSGVAPSDTVHVILSPDGTNHMDRLHHASLHLERYLGTPIPGPASVVIAAAGGLVATRRTRR